ncbi:MAG: beta-lactamase family protein [Saccharofermentans sp.]|nr:beta-lactamase family protein [Saccharofermentans sp.]
MKRIIKSFAVMLMAASVLVTPFRAYASSVDDVLDNDEWISYVEKSIVVDKTTALSVAAVKGSDAGFRSWGSVDEETPIHIGSCSKAFTALAVLLLQEDGKLSIEDSVSQYIPWWHVTYHEIDEDIKIWHLLNHCSGLPYVVIGTYTEFDVEQIARLAQDIELESRPGSFFRYTDFAYCILSYLVQKVSGVPFEEYIETEIMRPIGMTHSGYGLPYAQGHAYFFDSLIEHDDVQPKVNDGAALVVTTCSDLVLWMQAQLGVLDLQDNLANAIAASHERDLTHQPSVGAPSDYFNGWYQSADGIIWHSGLNPNYSSRLIINPSSGIAVCAVSNSTADTPYYAARSCFIMLSGLRADSFPEIERSFMHKCDVYASIITVVACVLLVAAFVLFIVRKNGISKAGLIIRLAVLVPLLGFFIVLPYLMGISAGYSDFGYHAFIVWGLRSEFIMCVVLNVLVVSLIVFSFVRYLRGRRQGSCRLC